ncbi:MFS transporter [Sphingomonas bacterium]|uniref:MFS transporter n=1 Tax=Sphingomonas bacterium TaxID=1895847 RepID=UPI0015762836|nr:MFS transporter [Sphingomonas bacterium]
MLLLFLAAAIYSIDKAIVGVLAEPIKHDLAISDVQMSLLLGLAYTMFGAILGVWFGNLVDRKVRRTLIAGAIILWSLSTAAGGLAPSFQWFFIFRAMVGLGEAAITPASFSLIADMFPPHQRGRALGTYLIGATVGTALSSVIPGWIIASDLHLMIPGFGAVAPWRSAFLICGMMGPIVGILFLTVREPARLGMSLSRGRSATLGEKLRYLWSQSAVIGPMFLGFGLFYTGFIGISAWTAPFVIRTYHLTLPQFANMMGLILLIGGAIGYIAGGLLADSPIGRRRGGKLAIMIALPIIALPCAFAGFAPSATVALIALATVALATPMLNVAMNASVQDLIPNDMRGFSIGLLSVLIALPAGAGGPFAVAYVTQVLLADPERIGTAFLIVGAPCFIAASASFFFAYRGILAAPPPEPDHV